jgi:hypothetical protein
MSNGNFDKEFNKQAISSFLTGILKSQQANQQRQKQIAYEQEIYRRGQKDKNYSANIKFLQDQIEKSLDPKVRQWAYNELAKLNAISSTPNETPTNELALQMMGLTKGAAQEYMRSGYDYPETERIEISADSEIGKIIPGLAGKTVTTELAFKEFMKYLKSQKTLSYLYTKYNNGKPFESVEQERKILEEKRKVIETRLKSFPRDMNNQIISNDPQVIQADNELKAINARLDEIRTTPPVGTNKIKQEEDETDRLLKIYLKSKGMNVD